MRVSYCYLLLLFLFPSSLKYFSQLCGANPDPTNGFISVPLSEYNFELQKPYDIPLEQRYSYVDGVRHLWVYADDKPHNPNSETQPRTEVRIRHKQKKYFNHPEHSKKEYMMTNSRVIKYILLFKRSGCYGYADDKPHNPNSETQPRTEVRIRGLDYSSGIWQFEGYGFVPNGTSGATVAQIHGAAQGATTIILRIYNGDMRYYSGDLVATDLYDKWFRLNIVHDVDGGTVTVYIDGLQKFQVKDKGPGDLYFKCGVYAAPRNISYYMESRWKDIKIYKKCQ